MQLTKEIFLISCYCDQRIYFELCIEVVSIKVFLNGKTPYLSPQNPKSTFFTVCLAFCIFYSSLTLKIDVQKPFHPYIGPANKCSLLK